jgi:hypothetical protein
VKIYGINRASGTYDDYVSYLEKTFYGSKPDAEKRLSELNDEIERSKMRIKKCNKCKIQDYLERRSTTESSFNEYIKTHKNVCEFLSLRIWKDLSLSCENFCGYGEVEHEPSIEEFELIEGEQKSNV